MRVDFAPALKSDEEAIETILEAVKKAGYEPGKDFRIAMDAASSEWKSEKGKDTINFQKQAQNIHQKSSLSTGLNYVRNIRSSLSKTVWMKKTGKDGRN